MVPGCIQCPDDSVVDLGHLSCTPKRCMVLRDGFRHSLWVDGGDQRIVVVGEAWRVYADSRRASGRCCGSR
jgi:hypothetical protein